MEAHLTIIIIISIMSIINGKQRSAIKIKENDTYYFWFLLLVNGVGQCWSLGNPHFSAKPSQPTRSWTTILSSIVMDE